MLQFYINSYEYETQNYKIEKLIIIKIKNFKKSLEKKLKLKINKL
jgi:hypothetical protein